MNKILHLLLYVIMPCTLLSISSLSGFSQSTTITGSVRGNNQEPLVGVTVAVKKSNTSVVTGANGQFSINVPSANSTLIFSHTGYVTSEILLGGKTSVDLNLKLAENELAGVVVVGYGTQRKASVTGSVATVKGDELRQTAVSNVAQGLQARIAGVQVTQNSSAPGGNVSVRVRGTNSLNGTSEPLYIVDGVQIGNSGGVNEISPLSTINPNDIESVDILKDASATAMNSEPVRPAKATTRLNRGDAIK